MEKEEPTTLGKRSEPDPEAITSGGDTSSKPKKCRTAERTCVHEVAVPSGYISTKD
ncbi:superkiller viralicidic activity 2-like 2, partial [Trifolium medium]|nr:superkiller viralicidic activity 2-like 2 [Trifolium medium]